MVKKEPTKYSTADQKSKTLGAETGKVSAVGALNTKNRMSSARGPYQILDGTWRDLEKSAGRKLNRQSVEDNDLAFELYTKKSEKALAQNGIEVNPGNAYALHVFGQQGGVEYLKRMKSNPDGLSTDGMSKEVINGNKPFFFDESGKPRTNADSYRKVSSRVGGPDDPGAISLQKENKRQAVAEQIRTQQEQRMQFEQQAQMQNQEQQQLENPEDVAQEAQLEPAQQEVQQAPISELSSASNSAGLMYSGNPGGKFILPKQAPVLDGVKTSGEASMKAKTFSFGGEITPEEAARLAAKKAAQAKASVVMTDIGYTPNTEKPFNNKESFDTKKIVKYQPGVTSGNNNGFYLYSKDPVNGGFNPERDREFINQSEMLAVQRTPQWKEYSANEALKKQQVKPVASMFADGGEINNGLLNDFNVGGTHEENPNGGINQGVGEDGAQNTVEEGETRMGDYIFSDRLTLDKADVDNLYLPKEVIGMTYADASKFINEFLEENPFDIIIKRTAESQLDSLKIGNDRAKSFKSQEEDIVAESNAPKFQFSGGPNKEVQEDPTQEQSEQFLSPEDQALVEQQELEQPQMAYGGRMRKFEGGGNPLFSGKGALSKDNAGATIGAGLGVATAGFELGMDAFKKHDVNDLDNVIQKKSVAGSAAAGALKMASAGAALGPWGAAGGALVGGIIGGLGAAKQNKAANTQDMGITAKMHNSKFGELAPEVQPVFPSNQNFRAYGGNMYHDGTKLKFLADKYIKKNDDSSNSVARVYAGEANKKIATNVTQQSNKPVFKMKGDSPLKYAGAVGALSNYINSRNEKPRVISSEMYSKTSTPNYFDESIIDNKMSQEMNNRSQAILATSGGSAAAARAMQYANSSEINKLKSDSYSKMYEINNAVRDKDQAETQRVADVNVGVRNQDYQANLQEQDFVQGRKEKARDNLYASVEAIGQEQSDKNLLFNLSGGYKGGVYDPEDKLSFQNMVSNWGQNRRKTSKADGGILSFVDNYENVQDKRKKYINEIKAQYNG
jgi:hypothetical protein